MSGNSPKEYCKTLITFQFNLSLPKYIDILKTVETKIT